MKAIFSLECPFFQSFQPAFLSAAPGLLPPVDGQCLSLCLLSFVIFFFFFVAQLQPISPQSAPVFPLLFPGTRNTLLTATSELLTQELAIGLPPESIARVEFSMVSSPASSSCDENACASSLVDVDFIQLFATLRRTRVHTILVTKVSSISRLFESEP